VIVSARTAPSRTRSSTRCAVREVPPKVEYSLTDFGGSLSEALIPLGDWGDRHMAHITETRRPAPVTG
jgi:DNA-binding HxlR family transcriptional regulator